MHACVGVVWACSISSLWALRCDKPASPLIWQTVLVVPLPGDGEELGWKKLSQRVVNLLGVSSWVTQSSVAPCMKIRPPEQSMQEGLMYQHDQVIFAKLQNARCSARCPCSWCGYPQRTQSIRHLSQLIWHWQHLREPPGCTLACYSFIHSCRAQVGSNSTEASFALLCWK